MTYQEFQQNLDEFERLCSQLDRSRDPLDDVQRAAELKQGLLLHAQELSIAYDLIEQLEAQRVREGGKHE